MFVCPPKARHGIRRADLFPYGFVDDLTASAVAPDCLDPFRRIRILDHSECGAGLPDAKHGNKRTRVPRKADQDKVLRSDFFLLQPRVDAGRLVIHLLSAITVSGQFFRQKYRCGIFDDNFRPAFTHIWNFAQKVKFHKRSLYLVSSMYEWIFT